MGFNISSLPAYVSQKSTELVVDTVFGAQTAKILKDAGSVQLGVKGSQAVQLMQADVNLQSGVSCGARNPLGNANFSQATLTVKPIFDQQNFCSAQLTNTWMVEYLTQGSTYTEALFANQIMAARAAKIAQENEKLLWIGDTTLTGSTNYNKIDGFAKQILAGAYISLSGATGTSVVQKLQNAFLLTPVKITEQPDAVIFLGTDVFNEYTVALTNLNIYKPVEDKTLFGTTIKLVPVDGLNGTRKIFVGRLRSFIMGTDLLDEADKAEMIYSNETRSIYMDFYYAMGVVPVYINEIGYTTV